MLKKLLIALVVLVVLALAAFFYLPTVVDGRMNTIEVPPPYKVSEAAQELHERIMVADLHNDVLLWPRDLLTHNVRGQTDLPRLRAGGVSLEVFSTVTKTPHNLNFERNAADSDDITLLALASRWPRRTWSSLTERALYQSRKLHEAAAASKGQLRIITTQGELADAIRNGKKGLDGHVLGVLSTEGMQALEGDAANIQRLADAGFRIMGLTHFFDNAVGGSAHGVDKGGLTPFGRDVVRALQERRLIVDLAHASPQVMADTLAISTRPLLVSHTGVQAVCPGPRNLSDAQIEAIAKDGGLIGIGFFQGAICVLDVDHIVRSIRHVADLVGFEHVALGSDFDGATRTVFDASGLPLVTQGLLDAGFSDSEITAIMGGNVLRFLLNALPPQ